MSQKAFTTNGGFEAIVPGKTQSITTSAISQILNPVALSTGLIRVLCTAACFIAIGASPTASSNTVYLLPNTIEYFGCNPGDIIAVIQSTAPGSFYLTEAA